MRIQKMKENLVEKNRDFCQPKLIALLSLVYDISC